MDGNDTRSRLQALRRFHFERKAVFVTWSIDANLIADEKRRQERHWSEPSEIHPNRAPPLPCDDRFAQSTHQGQTGRSFRSLILDEIDERVGWRQRREKESAVTV